MRDSRKRHNEIVDIRVLARLDDALVAHLTVQGISAKEDVLLDRALVQRGFLGH